MSSGIDHKNKNIIQGIKKLPPPLLATSRGKRQMFPVPIAIPMQANIIPMRELKNVVFATIITLYYYFELKDFISLLCL